MSDRRGAKPSQSHERLARDTNVKGSSDRGFGIVFTVVFAILGISAFYHDSAAALVADGAAGP